MKSWYDVLIQPDTTVLETMKLIDETTLQFAAVVNDKMRLLGTVTDGDIRRGILNGLSLESPIADVMNKLPFCEKAGKQLFYYKNQMHKRKLKQLPIISRENILQRIIFSDELDLAIKKDNLVILMVGGLGTRLRPLTDTVPKPMLNVGNKPILETIIESFKSYGFTNFILSVNYKKEMIMDYFQDGSHLDVNIEYIEEKKRLGTAGALALLPERPENPFIVMNGDLLTKINFEQLLDFHNTKESAATMCVREYEYQVPYGVIETDNHKLLSIVEKPVHKSFVNAGIYMFNPAVLDYMPPGDFFDMPELFKKLMEKENSVSAFPIREYWLDIGRMDDYERAKNDFDGGIK